MLKRLARFGIVGIIATSVHVAVAWLIFQFVVQRADVANVTAFLVANVLSYVLHTLWSFSAKMNWPQYIKFAVVSSFGLGLSAGLPILIGEDHFWLSTAAVLVAVPLSSFLLHNFWTYARRGS